MIKSEIFETKGDVPYSFCLDPVNTLTEFSVQTTYVFLLIG